MSYELTREGWASWLHGFMALVVFTSHLGLLYILGNWELLEQQQIFHLDHNF